MLTAFGVTRKFLARLTHASETGNVLGLCDPVRYEVSRGLLKVKATRKMRFFREELIPLMDHVALINEDWQAAAQLWATMRNHGRQFSNVDLLIASLAQRLNTVVVTADSDFAMHPIKSEDWRRSE